MKPSVDKVSNVMNNISKATNAGLPNNNLADINNQIPIDGNSIFVDAKKKLRNVLSNSSIFYILPKQVRSGKIYFNYIVIHNSLFTKNHLNTYKMSKIYDVGKVFLTSYLNLVQYKLKELI